jgi:hypothetical protein
VTHLALSMGAEYAFGERKIVALSVLARVLNETRTQDAW